MKLGLNILQNPPKTKPANPIQQAEVHDRRLCYPQRLARKRKGREIKFLRAPKKFSNWDIQNHGP